MRKLVRRAGLIAGGLVCLMTNQVRAEEALRAMPLAEETGLHVALGDITDNRTTGKNFARLEAELKTEGGALAQAFGVVKPVITAAVDDTGKTLLKDEGKSSPLFWSFEPFDKGRSRDNVQARAEMLNPARKATSLSFMGYVAVYDPKADPTALMTVPGMMAQAGKPLLPEAFQKAGLDITVMNKALTDKMKQDKAQAEAQKAAAKPGDAGQAMGQAFGEMFKSMFNGFFAMGENDLLFLVKDPQHQIAYLQVTDAQGTALKSGGRSFSQDEATGVIHYSVSYAAPLPSDAQLRIYFATPKSLQKVPFKFENVRLP